MFDEKLKRKAVYLLKKTIEKGLVKTYDEFCETEDAKEYALSEQDVDYYTSR